MSLDCLCAQLSPSLCWLEKAAGKVPGKPQPNCFFKRREIRAAFPLTSKARFGCAVPRAQYGGKLQDILLWRERHGKDTEVVVCSAAPSGIVETSNENDLYEVLGVERTADRAELKRAYRRLAKDFHPDVNGSPDAHDKFVALSSAYEVLIDEEQRALYDKYGMAGLKGRANKSEGAAWSVWDDTWDEFKPHKRKTRKGDAREAASAANGASPPGDGDDMAATGEVVEYPLSQAVMSRLDDGRTRGVGFIVSRNLDRGDRHKLPVEMLELVELEPLYREPGSEEWIADPLESAHFTTLSSVRRLRSEYSRAKDSWLILDELSPGCGSPEYAEEIIL